MRKRMLFLLLLIAIRELSLSQGLKIDGVVYDQQLNCLPSVNVEIVNGDDQQIASTLTGADGTFYFQQSAKQCDGLYLKVSLISYVTQKIKLNNCDTTLKVYLELFHYTLEGVEIGTEKPLFESNDGKIIVNVDQLQNLEALNSDKMLSRLPGVLVSNREGVTYNGQSATLYINGKQQQMSGKMAASFLEALPASMIKQVELTTINDGTNSVLSNGVTINLVMKDIGYNGYLLKMRGGCIYTDKPDNDFGGDGQVFFIIKKNRLVFNTNISYKNSLYWIDSQEKGKYTDSSALDSKSSGGGRTNVFNGLANLSYDFKNNHNLNFNFFFYTDYSKTDTRQTILKENRNNESYAYAAQYRGKGHDDLWTGNIEYTTPDTLKNSFKASYGFLYGGLRSQTDYYACDTSFLNQGEWYLNEKPTMLGFRNDLKFDYKHIFKDKSTLKFGILTDIGILNDNVDYTEPTTSDYYASSDFRGIEQDYEPYIMYNRKLGKFFSLNASLRYIHLHQDFDYISDGQKSSKSYDYLFPFISATFTTKKYDCAIGFVSGMIKPDYNSMLPGIRYEDDYTVRIGNPNVKPVVTYSIVFNQLFWKAFFISLRYDRLNDFDGYVLNQNSTSDLKIYEYMNYADMQKIYARLTIPYRFFKEKIYGNIEGTVAYKDLVKLKNGYQIDATRSDHYWEWQLSGNLNYNIAKGLSVYLWTRYLPLVNKPSTKEYARWTMDAGVSYTWGKNDRFAISLDGEDLFGTCAKIHRESFYYGNITDISAFYNSRAVKLSFAVKFKGGENVLKYSVDENKSDIERFTKSK